MKTAGSAVAIRPVVDRNVRELHGTRKTGLPMLTPAQAAQLSAHARLRLKALGTQPGTTPILIMPTSSRSRTTTQSQSVRHTSSTPSGQSGTGITPWWAYQTEPVPGVGDVNVNMGTGNFVLDAVDMSVPHKGVPLNFARTFNSQSQHDVLGSDGSSPGMYGNGWTSTYDVHLSGNDVTGPLTAWDDKGTRYDYTWNGSTWVPPTGRYATLVSDGACGFLWTMPSGVMYYMFRLDAIASCPLSFTTYGGYAGRLFQIFGRNANSYLLLNYSWVGGSGSSGKISSIEVTAESGLQSTLTFSMVGTVGPLLTQLKRPDGSLVTYGYGSSGTLASVNHPQNNNANSITEGYGWTTAPAGFTVMAYVTSPRWNQSCVGGSCGSDGGYMEFTYHYGTSIPATNLYEIYHVALVNPTISDGMTSGPLRSGFSTSYINYLAEAFTTGTTATLRDYYGHIKNWVLDTSGKPTQIQVSSGTTAGPFQTTVLKWDSSNNLISITDPRGNETDATYDNAGNIVAVGEPPEYQTYQRPTTLIDYDSFSNVVAFCDPAIVADNGGNWSGQYANPSDSYCTSLPGYTHHQTFAYTYQTYEPYGELTSTTTPNAYTRTISYSTSAQAGADYGLPTKISGQSIVQYSGNRQPSVSATYDTNGNVICTKADSSNSAASIMTYDSMNRLIASADPDDGSLTSAACPKTAGIPGSQIVTTRSYYLDGSLATIQTPFEAAAGHGMVYTYDYDGNLTSQAPYQSSPRNPSSSLFVRWYDGADRLVENKQLADPNTSGDFPLAMRYIYDISIGGPAPTISGSSVTAHGNLYEVQKNTPIAAMPAGTPGGWVDFKYSAFDPADRDTMDYAFAPCPAISGASRPSGPIYCSQSPYTTRYDWDSSTVPGTTAAPGLLVATFDALSEARIFSYDQWGRVANLTYAGDGGTTTPATYTYDFDKRLSGSSFSNPYPNAPSQVSNSYLYSLDGLLAEVYNSTQLATTAYGYYDDDTLAETSATLSNASNTGLIVSMPNLYTYNYRNDGNLASEGFGASNQSVSWTYTPAGRPTAMTDFGTSPSTTTQYDAYGRFSSYVTPAGSYAPLNFDPEGDLTAYTDPYTAVDGDITTSTFDARYDLIARAYKPNPNSNTDLGEPSKPGFQYRNVQGVLVQNATDQFDGRTGAPLIIGSSIVWGYDAVGRLTSGYAVLTYDAENRLLTGSTWALQAAGDAGCNAGGVAAAQGPIEQSYLYDGNGKLYQDVYKTGTRSTTREWYWDTNTALYATTMLPWSSGGGVESLDGYQADGLGTIPASGTSPGLTIADTDFDGAVSMYHNMTGHSGWVASNPYNQFCVSANPTAASPNYVGPTSATSPPTDDGTSDASLILESNGRTFVSSAVGYTAPDYSSATPYAQRSTAGAQRGLLIAMCGKGEYLDEHGNCVANPTSGPSGGSGPPAPPPLPFPFGGGTIRKLLPPLRHALGQCYESYQLATFDPMIATRCTPIFVPGNKGAPKIPHMICYWVGAFAGSAAGSVAGKLAAGIDPPWGFIATTVVGALAGSGTVMLCDSAGDP